MPKTERTKETRNAWSKMRTCVDCGKVESVRRDNDGIRCRSCAARHNGGVGLRAIKTRVKPIASCARCGITFRTNGHANKRANRRFCSRACREEPKLHRICKECGIEFDVLPSVLSGKTNASANFCCRPCYMNWLCRLNPNPSRGYGWHEIRRQARRAAPFCAYCGTTTRLDVHHIIPYRLTADNAHDNLIPLCRKHHKAVEMDFLEMERVVANDLGAAKQVLGAELRARQAETRKRRAA
jgi:hypothetical protein